MEKEKYNITPPAGTTEIILREGKTIDPKDTAEPSIKIAGVLSAPFEFMSKKDASRKTDDIHMLIDKEKGTIELILNDKSPYSQHRITGSLTPYAPLATFKINTEHRWAPKDLMKFFRTVKVHFDDKKDVDEIVTSLMKWQSNVETVIKEYNDNNGNSISMLEKKIGDIEMKRKFTLNMQIYKGYPKVKFMVEICFDTRNSVVDFFLISDELYELQVTQKESIIADEIAKFDTFNFSKVTIS